MPLTVFQATHGGATAQSGRDRGAEGAGGGEATTEGVGGGRGRRGKWGRGKESRSEEQKREDGKGNGGEREALLRVCGRAEAVDQAEDKMGEYYNRSLSDRLFTQVSSSRGSAGGDWRKQPKDIIAPAVGGRSQTRNWRQVSKDRRRAGDQMGGEGGREEDWEEVEEGDGEENRWRDEGGEGRGDSIFRFQVQRIFDDVMSVLLVPNITWRYTERSARVDGEEHRERGKGEGTEKRREGRKGEGVRKGDWRGKL
eukprot:766038-Hanusia_phi.AAC.2